MNGMLSRRLVSAGVITLAIVVAACGDTGGTGSGGGATSSGGADAPNTKLSGTIRIDGSSTVAPLTEAAAERFQGENSDVRVTVGTSGHRRWLREVLRRRDRHLGRLARDRGRRDRRVQRPGHHVRGVPGRQRRLLGRREHRERLGDVPDRRSAQDDLEHRLEGRQLEQGRPVVPRPEAGAVRPGHGLRDVRLLHRRDQRRGGREPLGLQRHRGRQRHRPGRLGRQGRPRLLRLVVLRAEQDKLKAVQVDGGRVCDAVVRDGAGRHLHAAEPPAVHLREGRSLDPEVEAFVEYFLENPAELTEQALFVPMTQAEQLPKLEAENGRTDRGRRSTTVAPRQCHLPEPAARRLGEARPRYGERLIVRGCSACAPPSRSRRPPAS